MLVEIKGNKQINSRDTNTFLVEHYAHLDNNLGDLTLCLNTHWLTTT